MALACAPDLVILDEPTTGLDMTTQKQVIDLLRRLRHSADMAMLYVTHDLGVLHEIADRVGIMYAGHIVEVAPTHQLFAGPRHPYTIGLLGSRPLLGPARNSNRTTLRGLLRRNKLRQAARSRHAATTPSRRAAHPGKAWRPSRQSTALRVSATRLWPQPRRTCRSGFRWRECASAAPVTSSNSRT